MGNWEVFPREAAAVGVRAQEQGVARLSLSHEELLSKARATIGEAQELTHFMMEKELIPPVPAEWS